MRPRTFPELEGYGLDRADAKRLELRIRGALSHRPPASTANRQVETWTQVSRILVSEPSVRWNFDLHRDLYRWVYADRNQEAGPGPAWVPAPADAARSNVGRLMRKRGFSAYSELHRWSVEHREEFWADLVQEFDVVFRRPPQRILARSTDLARPDWFPGAELNIAESCFQADPEKVAILAAWEGSPDQSRLTYRELRRLSARVASGFAALGVGRGERVALFMPMTPESVAIYLGTILAGRCVVGIADTSAPPEFAKRARIAGARAVFTIDAYVRDEKEHGIYEKVVAADGPRAIVLPSHGEQETRTIRAGDVAWEDFLGGGEEFTAVPCRPSDPTNILFSSGTTKDPKAIPWTHVTPIKSAADAFLHHDAQESDVLAWPTSFGWMMGPWLTYASLINGATMALFVGAPHRREFGEFVEHAGVTMLGVVPKLVRSWMTGRTMEGLDWSRIRLLTSTAEPSTPDEMLYLMFLAGYRPIIEYCGGTEIGGGYITGTVVQPCAPSTFTTPALGLDLLILDDGTPAPRGEVFLIPPSIGLSNELLNYDHFAEYYEGLPQGPNGEVLRRHGDQLERLGGGYYRHHGRIDDMINLNGVKTSAEEIRSAIGHEAVYDAKPTAVDVDGSGQHVLVIYAVPRDPTQVDSPDFRERLRQDFRRAIKEKLNPLLAHVHDVVLVPELPQAGPGKTRTTKELQRDYLSRIRASAGRSA